MKFKVHKYIVFSSAVLSLAFASSSQAATLSWSSTVPTVDGADIANFVGVAADADNILGGDDQGTYVAIGRDAVGQTFTTGSNAGGYEVSAITLQQVSYDTYWSLDTGWNGYNGGSFEVQIGTIAAGIFTPLLAGETALMDASAPANQNPGTGSSMYATLTLDTPIALSANTVYGFAIFSSNDGVTDINNGPYFEANGSGLTSDNYAGGEAFGLAAAGGSIPSVTDAVNSFTGDRVFHLNMTAVPEPSAGVMALAGIGILLGVVRRRS